MGPIDSISIQPSSIHFTYWPQTTYLVCAMGGGHTNLYGNHRLQSRAALYKQTLGNPAKFCKIVNGVIMLTTSSLKIVTKAQAVVYCTCSVYPEENEAVVKKALELQDLGTKVQPYR